MYIWIRAPSVELLTYNLYSLETVAQCCETWCDVTMCDTRLLEKFKNTPHRQDDIRT